MGFRIRKQLHIHIDLYLFVNINTTNSNTVTIANGNTLEPHGTSTIKMHTLSNDIALNAFLYVPDLHWYLMSVTKVMKHGCKLTPENNIYNSTHNGKSFIEGKVKNKYAIQNTNKNLSEQTQERKLNYDNLSYQCKNKNFLCFGISNRMIRTYI